MIQSSFTKGPESHYVHDHIFINALCTTPHPLSSPLESHLCQSPCPTAGVKFTAYNVLDDQVLREGIKKFR